MAELYGLILISPFILGLRRLAGSCSMMKPKRLCLKRDLWRELWDDAGEFGVLYSLRTVVTHIYYFGRGSEAGPAEEYKILLKGQVVSKGWL